MTVGTGGKSAKARQQNPRRARRAAGLSKLGRFWLSVVGTIGFLGEVGAFGASGCIWCCPKQRSRIAAPVGHRAGRPRPAELGTVHPAKLVNRGKQIVVGAAERPDLIATIRSE